jgi:hypothetical protein
MPLPASIRCRPGVVGYPLDAGPVPLLRRDPGLEEAARKPGWTRVGEVSLQIVTPEPPAKPPTVGASPASAAATGKLPSRVSVSERIRLALTRWLEHGKK